MDVVKDMDSPIWRLADVLFSVMDVTYTGVTVILQVALRFVPSVVFAVMTAFPGARAVTFPLETDATELFELLHSTSLYVASSGFTVATRVRLSPVVNSAAVLFNDIEDASFAFTVTVQVAFRLEPSVVSTVMVALPGFFAVTYPLFTVATLSSELLHTTSLFVAFCG